MPKTELELDQLKAYWRNDPSWDIEATEGFEDHYKELLYWRWQQEHSRRIMRQLKLMDLAKRLGVPGNIELAIYVESLEARIDSLEKRLLSDE